MEWIKGYTKLLKEAGTVKHQQDVVFNIFSATIRGSEWQFKQNHHPEGEGVEGRHWKQVSVMDGVVELAVSCAWDGRTWTTEVNIAARKGTPAHVRALTTWTPDRDVYMDDAVLEAAEDLLLRQLAGFCAIYFHNAVLDVTVDRGGAE